VGGTLNHKLFCEQFVSGLIQAAQDIDPTPSTSGCGRLSSQAVCVSWLDFMHSHHWPTKGSSQRCCLCAFKGKVSRSFYYCEGSNVGLCLYPCFKLYHTMLHYRKCLQKNQLYFQWHIFTYGSRSGVLINWDNPVTLTKHVYERDTIWVHDVNSVYILS
jgi:hypothetical protein